MPDKVQFHYIKNSDYRTIHADGAYGGMTPDRNIFLALWNNRAPIPESITFAVENGMITSREVERECRDGVVREVSAGIVFSKTVAISLRDWLSNVIAAIDSHEPQPQKEQIDETAKHTH